MANEYPLINGVRTSWAEIELRAKGRSRYGVKEVSYSSSLEPGEVHGAGVRKLGRTRGVLKHEASITMLKEEADEFVGELGPGFGEVSFEAVVSYAEGAKTKVDTIVGCRIKNISNSHQQGNEGLTVKLDLDVMEILYSGQPMAKREKFIR